MQLSIMRERQSTQSDRSASASEYGKIDLCDRGDTEMIKVSVFYANGEGKTFDMDYYCDRHMVMVREKLGAACQRIEIDAGLQGVDPGSPPLYLAMSHLFFESVEAFQTAFDPHAKTLLADVPNYTNVEPCFQISEVKL